MLTTTHSNDETSRQDGEQQLPCLTVVHHPDARWLGMWTSLRQGESLELGRDANCLGAQVLADRTLSRLHARIVPGSGGTAELRDLKSRNGTDLNGKRVEAAVLRHGDIIGLGAILLLYHLAPGSRRAHRSDRIIGVGSRIGEVLEQISQVAPHRTTVLITGETGTGKELVAQELHARSGRKGGLIATNCGGVADSLLQSELFGCVRGAYSGADRDRQGLFELADGGTILLDEIGDASEALQRSLLRVLQDGRVQRLGATSSVQVDARVIAATHRDLVSMIAAGRFREDLYARLSGWVIHVPSLRERREDIPLIVRSLLQHRGEGNRPVHRNLMLRLLLHDYPRNVRELCKIIERAVIEVREGPLTLTPGIEALLRPPTVQQPSESPDLLRGKGPPSAQQLKELLAQHNGNVTHLAQALHVGRNTLYRWLKGAGLDIEDVRAK